MYEVILKEVYIPTPDFSIRLSVDNPMRCHLSGRLRPCAAHIAARLQKLRLTAYVDYMLTPELESAWFFIPRHSASKLSSAMSFVASVFQDYAKLAPAQYIYISPRRAEQIVVEDIPSQSSKQPWLRIYRRGGDSRIRHNQELQQQYLAALKTNPCCQSAEVSYDPAEPDFAYFTVKLFWWARATQPLRRELVGVYPLG